jgi:glycosyltransferase involved in cell wall biosynthesis
MEGGAHVVMEAVCCGTPVLASQIPGNVGMLGDDYAGYFEAGDAAGLAARLRQCHAELTVAQAGGASSLSSPSLLAQLQAQCAARAPLFSPATEQAALRRLVDQL